MGIAVLVLTLERPFETGHGKVRKPPAEWLLMNTGCFADQFSPFNVPALEVGVEEDPATRADRPSTTLALGRGSRR